MTNPITNAARLLREAAAELKNCHTRGDDDWAGEQEAKAAYDEYMDVATAIEAAAPSQCLHQISEPTPAPAAAAGPSDPVDALLWGANVAETLLSIGRAIGFGRAQQILGEQWEVDCDCAPRGSMGVTAKDHLAFNALRACKQAPDCTRCSGSGEDPEGYLTHGHGPDDHTVDGPCRSCAKMSGGMGMHYLNYGREILTRWGSASAAAAPVVLPEPAESTAPTLRAMALNYTPGHSWDHLDADACLKGAAEIDRLRALLAQSPVAVDVQGVAQFTKRPVMISAIQWTGSNLSEVTAFIEGQPDTRHPKAADAWEAYEGLVARDGLKIHTLEGKMLANVGDWIIRGVKGEFYPCKPDIFAATYEVAAAPAAPAKLDNIDVLLAAVRALPMVRATETDDGGTDGTPKRWRNRPFVSLVKLERLLHEYAIVPSAPAVDADPLGLRDVGEALMATIECNAEALTAVGWTAPMDCPSEIVVDLLNLLDEAKAAPAVDALAPVQALLDMHAELLDANPYAYFELAYTRQTGWMAWITDKPMYGAQLINPERKVLARGHGDTPAEACAAAAQAEEGEAA